MTTKLYSVAISVVVLGVLAAFVKTTSADEKSHATHKNTAVALGTIDVKNGTTDVGVGKAALDPDPTGTSPEATGKIKNSTGAALDDVTIVIKNKGTGTGDVPTAKSAKITQGSNSSSGNFTGVAGGGYKVTIDLGAGGSPAGPIANGNSVDLDLEIDDAGSTPPNDFNVRVTGSVKNKPKGAGSSIHADVGGKFELDSTKIKSKNVLHESWHDRIASRIKNVDTGRSATVFTCQVGLPSGVTISSVTLQDPDNSFNTVSGSTTTIDGLNFTISGFTLSHGDEYEVVVVYSEVPGNSTWLEIEATFPE